MESKLVRTCGTWLGVTLAAVASIATSQPAWSVVAALPQQTSPAVGTAFVYTVSASENPTAEVSPDHESRLLTLSASGTANIVIFAGQTLDEVRIGGACNGGGNSCDRPAGAFVTVSAPNTVPAWSSGTSSKVLNPNHAQSGWISVAYTHEGDAPVRLSVSGCASSGSSAGSVDAGSVGQGALYVDSCTVSEPTVTATIDGICAAPGCLAPPGETIQITSASLNP